MAGVEARHWLLSPYVFSIRWPGVRVGRNLDGRGALTISDEILTVGLPTTFPGTTAFGRKQTLALQQFLLI